MLDVQPTTPEIPKALLGPYARAMEAHERLKSYVCQLHDQGYTMGQISDLCSISEATLMLWRRQKDQVRHRSPNGGNRLDAYAEEIEAAHRSGELLSDIADRFGTTVAKISTYAKMKGWPPRGHKGHKGSRIIHHHLDSELESIRELYEAGISAAEIGRRYNVSSVTIRCRAQRMGWERPPSGEAERDELIYQYLQEGLSVRGIHRNTRIGRQRIREIMKRYGWRTLPGASDELAGAPQRYEEAIPQRGIRRRLAPRQAPPKEMDPKAQKDREELKSIALHLEQMGLRVKQVCAACSITDDTLCIFRREEGRQRVNSPKGHSWTDEHEELLRKAWFSDLDLSVRALAKRLRLTRWHLNDLAARRGWPPRKPGRKKDSPVPGRTVLVHRHDELRALWDEGKSAKAIGDHFGVTGGTVLGYARRHNFPRRLTPREIHEERVFQCVMDGMSIHGIAFQLDLTRGFISGLIKSRRWKNTKYKSWMPVARRSKRPYYSHRH